MPTFNNIEVTATVDIEFEVYCSCGAHMCGNTDTRASRNRGVAQAVVSPCEKCIETATEELKNKIDELEAELAEAKLGQE
jgi:hypothetical protein